MGKSRTVLAFGVFDMLHPGHEYFLTEAGKLGILHVCLASDAYVEHMKHKRPMHTYVQRREMLRLRFPEVVIHAGDETVGIWSIFKEIQPDAIAIGYDQHELCRALKNIGLNNFVFIEPYKENQYKTSLLSK